MFSMDVGFLKVLWVTLVVGTFLNVSEGAELEVAEFRLSPLEKNSLNILKLAMECMHQGGSSLYERNECTMVAMYRCSDSCSSSFCSSCSSVARLEQQLLREERVKGVDNLRAVQTLIVCIDTTPVRSLGRSDSHLPHPYSLQPIGGADPRVQYADDQNFFEDAGIAQTPKGQILGVATSRITQEDLDKEALEGVANPEYDISRTPSSISPETQSRRLIPTPERLRESAPKTVTHADPFNMTYGTDEKTEREAPNSNNAATNGSSPKGISADESSGRLESDREKESRTTKLATGPESSTSTLDNAEVSNSLLEAKEGTKNSTFARGNSSTDEMSQTFADLFFNALNPFGFNTSSFSDFFTTSNPYVVVQEARMHRLYDSPDGKIHLTRTVAVRNPEDTDFTVNSFTISNLPESDAFLPPSTSNPSEADSSSLQQNLSRAGDDVVPQNVENTEAVSEAAESKGEESKELRAQITNQNFQGQLGDDDSSPAAHPEEKRLGSAIEAADLLEWTDGSGREQPAATSETPFSEVTPSSQGLSYSDLTQEHLAGQVAKTVDMTLAAMRPYAEKTLEAAANLNLRSTDRDTFLDVASVILILANHPAVIHLENDSKRFKLSL